MIMKKLLFATVLLIQLNCYAGTTYFVTGTSDYISRGITQTSHEAALQAGFEVTPIENLILGFWTSNAFGESEINLYPRYNIKFDETTTLGISGLFYTYSQSKSFDTFDYRLYLDNKYVNLMLSYMDNYFGTKTSDLYVELSKKVTINQTQKESVTLTAGYTDVDDEDKAGFADYTHGRINLNKETDFFELSIFYSDSNRKTVTSGVKSEIDDRTVGTMLSKVF